PIPTSDYYALAGVFASTRMVNRTADGKDVDGKTKSDKMPSDVLHIVADGEPKNLNVFLRGSPDRKGPMAARHFLSVLLPGAPVEFERGSGRQELAAAIVSNKNPLTARVMVNRLWSCFFGQPLVATPSNFGHSGQPPRQPELLDDLAARFMERGWSIKTLVREMVLSATYRQDSRSRSMATPVDADDCFLSPMPRRRLTIEQWRDSVLFVAGELELAAGKSLELSDPANKRRTVYARVSRLKLDDLLMQFDYPDANVHAEKRAATTTPMQRLFMLNSPFIQDRALALVRRVFAEAGASDPARIRHLHALLLSREPDGAELKLALEFLRKPAPSDFPRWAQYAQMLLASNEMLYVD
ncbi:MAG: hypothetical protein QOF48_1126, partial [Verrucomicrobiota bacterium]